LTSVFNNTWILWVPRRFRAEVLERHIPHDIPGSLPQISAKTQRSPRQVKPESSRPPDIYSCNFQALPAIESITMPGPIHPQYVPKDTGAQSSFTSSLTVLRVADNASFLASRIPTTKTKDPKKDTANKLLAPAIIPTAGVPISRILNHPNIISLVDIVQASSFPGKNVPGEYGDLTIWEDMDAGCLEYLLPSPNDLPDFTDSEGWHALAAQNFQRFSLPESLCWHVLISVSKALLWLHYGIKESEGILDEAMRHDDDWQPILIRDISPGQVWFKKPRPKETYGECKLGGFQWAKVTGLVGGSIAICPRVDEASREKQYYWAPVGSLASFFSRRI
jgi:hypothetical protein